jgi:hypothetical protein
MELDKITLDELIKRPFIVLNENEILSRPNDMELGDYVRTKLNKKKYEGDLEKIKKGS